MDARYRPYSAGEARARLDEVEAQLSDHDDETGVARAYRAWARFLSGDPGADDAFERAHAATPESPVAAYLSGDVKRIVLTRPAVEAGEKLGFLPGDLTEKVDPYLRPLFDALHDMLPQERVQRMIERNVIEGGCPTQVSTAVLATGAGARLQNNAIWLHKARKLDI